MSPRDLRSGTEHLVPQACIEVDSIRGAFENQFRWFPDLERRRNGLEQLTPDAQTMKRRFDDSLLDPSVLSEPSMDLGDVLVELPVDGEERVVWPRLARKHPTKPALPGRLPHDDADQHVAHVSATQASLLAHSVNRGVNRLQDPPRLEDRWTVHLHSEGFVDERARSNSRDARWQFRHVAHRRGLLLHESRNGPVHPAHGHSLYVHRRRRRAHASRAGLRGRDAVHRPVPPGRLPGRPRPSAPAPLLPPHHHLVEVHSCITPRNRGPTDNSMRWSIPQIHVRGP